MALAQETDAARRAGVVAADVSSVEFDSLAAEAERMIYVVAGGRLLASKRLAMGEHITHAVLVDGGPVQAAGEFEVMEHESAKVVMALNNVSGHYQPGVESLEVAREAFEALGWRVLQDGVEQYDWRAP